jgi:hypothetical protein
VGKFTAQVVSDAYTKYHDDLFRVLFQLYNNYSNSTRIYDR